MCIRDRVESLQKCNLMLKKGTIVDSTLIAAHSSTKNKEKQRDPEAHSVKKGNQRYFGYKEHIGVDADSGLVHTVETTAAKDVYKRQAQGNRTCEIRGAFQSGTCVLRTVFRP